MDRTEVKHALPMTENRTLVDYQAGAPSLRGSFTGFAVLYTNGIRLCIRGCHGMSNFSRNEKT